MIHPLKIMIIGPTKSGKTWKGMTTPPPRLYIDLEGKARYTPQAEGATFWDGESDPMKLAKSKTQTYIVETNDLNVLSTMRDWIRRPGMHPFASFTLDSVMEYKAAIVKEHLPGVYDPEPKQTMKINNVLEEHMRDLKDIVMDPKNKLKCGLFLTGAGKNPFEGGRVYALIGGRVGDLMPYWMDVMGYQEVEIPKGRTEGTRKLHLLQRPANDLDVGDNTNIIVKAVGNPISDDVTITDMFNALQEGKKLNG